MVVGAPYDSWGGSARVYVRTGSTWTLQARLAGTDEEEPRFEPRTGAAAFGTSVAISGDGNTIIVGAPRNSWFGLVSIFTRSEGIWTLEQRQSGTGYPCAESCRAGEDVALSGNGGEAAYLGYEEYAGGRYYEGRAALNVSGTGLERLPFHGLPPVSPVESVAVSADGNTVLVSGLQRVTFYEPCPVQPERLCERTKTSKAGLVFAFTRAGSTWQEQTISGAGESGEGEFGSSLALSSNGGTALIGGSADNGGAGAAWVFTHSASGWSQQGGKLTANSEIGAGEFGESVALSADGNKALIGGPGDNGNVGAAWEFTRSGEAWTQQPSKLTASDETGEGRFASSLALSGEGDEAVIGAPGDDGGVGALWSFGPEPEGESHRHHR